MSDWFSNLFSGGADALSGADLQDIVHTVGVDQGVSSAVGGGFDGSTDWWSGISNALGGTSGLTRLAGGVIGAGGNILASNQAQAGVNQAAAIQAAALAAAGMAAGEANKEARDIMLARSDRGLGEIDAGMNRYRETVDPLLTQKPVVIPQYRGMTPQQTIGLEDLRRSGMASLAASGMRGAGRAGIGTLMDQERRYRADVAAGNDTDTRGELRRTQTNANTARQGLASAELQTGGAKANANMMVGNNLASLITGGGQSAGSLPAQTGQSAADAARTTGAIGANATTSTANVLGGTLGQLGALFADQQRKEQQQNTGWGNI
ncbi:hypothetical protein UFOVP469_2 [uncultured Caudovirales phage]|uniref:Uncharacterized protein n=1 Tax=uncultured Caudovirales phage TaxID=2100421 RepID=A0A6J5MF23_9CAUD|nr:hypothetical protein UFOVP469_2 [uncultured Caudovirales phage]CAB4190049.1 hypothetical protein UFOVP1200_32 [uncultured Caudovirales phage]